MIMEGEAVVRVPRESSAKRAGEMLQFLPVADIAITEIEADEVIRALFTPEEAGGTNDAAQAV